MIKSARPASRLGLVLTALAVPAVGHAASVTVGGALEVRQTLTFVAARPMTQARGAAATSDTYLVTGDPGRIYRVAPLAGGRGAAIHSDTVGDVTASGQGRLDAQGRDVLRVRRGVADPGSGRPPALSLAYE